MKNSRQAIPSSIMEVRENTYNLQFIVGDAVDFLFNEARMLYQARCSKNTPTAVWWTSVRILD
ncbi:MAG: hypothetical protein ACLRPU_17310 [Enterococcus hulanensis]